MICSALNYWTTCPRNHALTQLHTRRVLPGVPFWAPSKHLDISSGSLPHIIIMARKSPLSGRAYASLGLTVGLFSLLVSSPAFAQDDQAEPGLPPPAYPFPHPTPPFASGNGQAEPGFPPSRSPPPGSYQVQSPGYTPSHDEGLLVMPYVGFVTPVGSATDYYGTGLRIGTLLGWHFSRYLSINAEFTFDILNPKGIASSFENYTFDYSLSPLLHLPIGKLALIVGPKIGLFNENLIYTVNGNSYNESFSGVLFGVNASLLVDLGRLEVGGLFSYTGRSYSSPCHVIDEGENRCTYVSGAFHTVSFNGVILF